MSPQNTESKYCKIRSTALTGIGAEPENLASSSGVGIGLPITARPYPVSLGEPPAQGLVQFERMAGSTPPAGSPVRDVMKDLPEAPA